MAAPNYKDMDEDELYYLVGQAAVWYFIKGGRRGNLDDLLDDAQDDAREHHEAKAS